MKTFFLLLYCLVPAFAQNSIWIQVLHSTRGRIYARVDGASLIATDGPIPTLSCVTPPRYVEVLVQHTERFVVTNGLSALTLSTAPATNTEIRVVRNGVELDTTAKGGADDYSITGATITISSAAGGLVVGDTYKVHYFTRQSVPITP